MGARRPVLAGFIRTYAIQRPSGENLDPTSVKRVRKNGCWAWVPFNGRTQRSRPVSGARY